MTTIPTRLPCLATLTLVAGLCATSVTAQTNRITINGQPTNLRVDWSSVAVAPDPASPNTFTALMPLSAVSTWAAFDPVQSMDLSYGPHAGGNWLRCAMMATDWAYLSTDACAHAWSCSPAAGCVGAAKSLLTSTFDYGPYSGTTGNPNFPVPSVSLFVGGNPLTNELDGLDYPDWDPESWQLRTRGFFPTDSWNGCPTSNLVTPNFTGFLAARFTFSFH